MRYETDFEKGYDVLSIHEWLFGNFLKSAEKHGISPDKSEEDIHVKMRLVVMKKGEKETEE